MKLETKREIADSYNIADNSACQMLRVSNFQFLLGLACKTNAVISNVFTAEVEKIGVACFSYE